MKEVLYIQNKNTRLYTTVYPNQHKETIIFLHGGPGAPDGLGPMAEYLSSHFQVIEFHQRGTLNSPCPSHDYSVKAYISDIDCIARYFHLDRFHLLGHSWGGLYAQLYAGQRPTFVRSLFLISPCTGTGWQWVKMGVEIGRFNKRRSSLLEWVSMCKNGLLGVLGSNVAFTQFYTQFCINCNKGYQVENPVPFLVDHIKARPIIRTNTRVFFYHRLKRVPAPEYKITVTYGDNDVIGPSRRYVRKRYPTASFITVRGTSHLPWLQNEEVFYRILAEHYAIKK
ncbi:alpha/beta fold hydrolase [Telluribacter sp. SYSU D00476]|uniref:alpha/beta fold hydrolase n=1 Tax=Telluribacter sp. SYSU D00476 TaxID=2811430 RepID=UPI001FF2A112|nr:alpha/beta hydrolase [Telluribacter sp. SYSU D00476]